MRLQHIEQTVEGMSQTLNTLLRAVQGEIDAGNVGLVRRVTRIEKRIDDELATAARVHRELEQSIIGLKVKMAGYGFLGSGVGGGLLIAVLRASNNLG